MYESPIDKWVGEIQTKLEQQENEMLFNTVRDVGIIVNKEELFKALEYDRNQYEKGYCEGYREGVRDIIKDIERKLKDVE